MPKNCENVLELDFTENNLNGASDLRFLMLVPKLKTLILDKNQIQSNFIIPSMENLTTLCVNHNKIDNLSIFIKNLCSSCPNLTYLSMLNNPAAPSYFNGGSVAEHKNYRFYVVSRLRNLKMLDDKEISDEERSQATTIYGKLITKKLKTTKKKADTISKPLVEINKNDFIDDHNIDETFIDVLPNLSHSEIKPSITQQIEIEVDKLPSIDSMSSQSSLSSSSSPNYLENLPNVSSF